MNSLVELLSNEEIKAFENYVDYYAPEEFATRSVSGDYLLRFWAREKDEYLYKLFGENLILSKEVTFEKNIEQIKREMSTLFEEDSFVGEFQSNVTNKFWRQFVSAGRGEKSDSYEELYCNIDNFFSAKRVAEIVYDGPTFMIPTPNGKEIKVQNGCKVMRTLGKIVTAFDLNPNYFEAFRIKVSQILNQKIVKGELCISIHPLDYVTMSDNDSDWSSCMSWNDRGCYRQGTVEMMNSPMVIVAYLKSSSDMTLPGGLKWSNKKWRELFVVNRDIIVNIKSYPYHNPTLTREVMKWLKDLADQNLADFSFNDTLLTAPKGSLGFETENHKTVYIHPDCNIMYNDFHNDPYENICYIRTCYIEEGEEIYFNYSGESECMACGEPADFYDCEGRLVGYCCDSYYTCDCCGENYQNEDDLIEVDGRYLCPDCYDNETVWDDILEEYHLRTNCYKIHILTKAYPNKQCGEFWVYEMDELNKDYVTTLHAYEYLNRYRQMFYFVYLEDLTEKLLNILDLNESFIKSIHNDEKFRQVQLTNIDLDFNVIEPEMREASSLNDLMYGGSHYNIFINTNDPIIRVGHAYFDFTEGSKEKVIKDYSSALGYITAF